MKALISFVALFTVTTLISAQTAPPLWQKAVHILSENLDWTPGAMTVKIEMLDKQGDAEMTTISAYKISLGENGEVKSELVQALQNGKDVTEEEKQRLEKEETKKEKSNNSVGFSLTADGRFYPTQTVFEGAAGILFIKKSFRGTIRFGDYWRNGDKQ